MKTGLLYTLVLSIISLGFIAWRVWVVKALEPTHFVILFDQSLSHPESCESLLGLAEQAFHAEGVSRGSTLTVLVLGDRTSANQPSQLAEYFIPRTQKVLEGRNANRRREQELLRDLLKKCQDLRPTTISPILVGVQIAVAELRAQGCGPSSHCQLFVDSDLEENAEPYVRKIIEGNTSFKGKLPPPINNSGIHVTFCGFAITTGRVIDSTTRELPRSTGRDDRLLHLWSSMFTEPGPIEFKPYCAKPSEPVLSTSPQP